MLWYSQASFATENHTSTAQLSESFRCISDWQTWFLGSRRPRGDYPPTTTRTCGHCGIVKPFVVQKKAPADCLTGLPSRQWQQKLTTLSPIDERGDAACIKRWLACRWLHSQLLPKPRRAPRQHTAGKTSSSSRLHGRMAPFRMWP